MKSYAEESIDAFEATVKTITFRKEYGSEIENGMCDLFTKMVRHQLLEVTRLARIGLEYDINEGEIK